MKIYTKTGDSGSTSLFAGRRVDKNSSRVHAYGSVDELNSLIGVVLTQKLNSEVSKKLFRLQSELFVLGTDLSSLYDVKVKTPRIRLPYIKRLESEIDRMEKSLKPLKNFILPGGSEASAKLHLARSIARRTERFIVQLSKEEEINKYALMYINRLSDWLFVLARYVNRSEGKKETIWEGRKKS